MADSCAGGECREVARMHSMKFSIDPGVNFAFDDEDKLLFVRFGVRPRRTAAGRKALQIDAKTHQTGSAAGTANRTHGLFALRIDVAALWQVTGRDYERWAWTHEFPNKQGVCVPPNVR